MISHKQDFAAVTIRKHGYGSSSLFNLKKGDKLGIRGPYGNYFVFKEYKNIVLIGGGTGLVPRKIIKPTKTRKNRNNYNYRFKN